MTLLVLRGSRIERLCQGEILRTSVCRPLCILGYRVRIFAGTYSGGDGSVENPYQISSADDLLELGATTEDYGQYFILTSDIDLAGQTFNRAVIAPDTNNSTSTFEGSAFRGSLNGNGHAISNLEINTVGVGGYYLGLFGQISGFSAVIKDLSIEDVSITGSASFLGAVCGSNNCGTISNCCSIGSISGAEKSSYVGGLCGSNDGTVSNCYSVCQVSSGEDAGSVGGLCGGNGGSVVNCYARGYVSGGWSSLGGLCGRNGYCGSITNCYSAVATNRGGGLCGRDSGFICNSYFLAPNDGGGSDNGIGLPLTDLQMRMQACFANWDFANEAVNGTCEIWQMRTEGGYPELSTFNGYVAVVLDGDGTDLNPYSIGSPEELGAMYHYSQKAFFRLNDDIDLSGIRWASAVMPFFAGYLDGNGHTIRGLNIAGGSQLGLFGTLAGPHSEIKDLVLRDINVSGGAYTKYVSALCSYNDHGLIANCSLEGVVTTGYWTSYTGGLCGYNDGGSINSCRVDGLLTCADNSSYFGGLCGYNSQGTINSCSVNGSVVGAGCSNFGGLCGYSTGTIVNCSSRDSVSGASDSHTIGGLCGGNRGEIISSSAEGEALVAGGYASADVGGLCGANDYCGLISGCHATIGVTSGDGTSGVGGLCGQNSGVINISYATGAVKSGEDSDGLGGFCGINAQEITNCYSTGSVAGGYCSDNQGGFCGWNRVFGLQLFYGAGYGL